MNKGGQVSVNSKSSALILGVSIFLGLSMLGYLLADAAIKFKEYERTVTVKGLSEREYEADVVIWPIQFSEAGNDLAELYLAIESSTNKIRKFLAGNGIREKDISVSAPFIKDKSAQLYGNSGNAKFRYAAIQTITVYSGDVGLVRRVMGLLSRLGKQGIVFTGGDYESKPEYIFTRLNEIKPGMIEEATKKAREVAEKFALDSRSTLGKIRKASQGQFSISPRDKNNPHIKKVRVVSTVEYYLSD